MIAVSSNNQLAFKNICGGLKFQFLGVDRICSIRIEGMDGEPISGNATVTGYVDGSAPTITMSSEATESVTLDCRDGVQLDPDSPTTFIIALPPVEFKTGIRITVVDADGLSKTLTNTSANIVKRSSLLTFPVITYIQDDVFEITEVTSYTMPADGGKISIPLTTNMDYKVVIPESAANWISAVKTKALSNETIYNNPMRMTTDIYNKISVPGANLGTGVIRGTDAQYILAQEVAINAYNEGKEFVKLHHKSLTE